MSDTKPITSIDKRALLRQAALEYHEFPKPGKVAITATKPMANQRDLTEILHTLKQVVCVKG